MGAKSSREHSLGTTQQKKGCEWKTVTKIHSICGRKVRTRPKRARNTGSTKEAVSAMIVDQCPNDVLSLNK